MLNNRCVGFDGKADRFSQKIKPSLLALAVAQAIASAPAAQAATINLGGGCTLSDAVIAANTDTISGSCTAGSGPDVINLEAGGTQVELDRFAATPNGLPIITSNITINGDGGTVFREIENPEKFRLMEVAGASASLTLNSITLRGGYAYSSSFPDFHGGGIYLNNSASLVGNSIFVEDNIARRESGTSGNGGGINATQAGTSVELTNSVVSSNQAFGFGGGIYIYYGDLTLTSVEVSGNSSRNDGGGIAAFRVQLVGESLTIYQNTAGNAFSNSSGGGVFANYNTSVNISNSTIEGNSATDEGGGFFGDFLVGATFTETQILQNTASNLGGGIYARRTTTVSVNGGAISGNSTGIAGGGIYASNGSTVTLQSTTVSSNTAGPDGGTRYGGGAAIRDDATLISNDTIWASNYSRFGGAIASRSSISATININNSTFTGNSAAAQGGAIRVRFGTEVTVNQSAFTQNSAINQGGAISNQATLPMTLKNSTFFENSAREGAGINNIAELTVINSTVSANTATNYGGGLVATGGNTTLINTTIVANQATTVEGGGVFTFDTGNTTLRNCIVAGNTAPQGAEISDAQGGLIVADANNLLGSSAVTSAEAFHQFVPGGSDITATSSVTPTFTLAKMVDGLADNGGPTLTHALANNSPAINRGDPISCIADLVVTDQRGEERDARCDIGAFESPDNGAVFVVPLPGGKAVIFEL